MSTNVLAMVFAGVAVLTIIGFLVIPTLNDRREKKRWRALMRRARSGCSV